MCYRKAMFCGSFSAAEGVTSISAHGLVPVCLVATILPIRSKCYLHVGMICVQECVLSRTIFVVLE